MIRSCLAAVAFCAASALPAHAASLLDYAQIEQSIIDRPLAYVRGGDVGQIVYDSSNQVVITRPNGDVEYGQWQQDGNQICVRMQTGTAGSGCFSVSRGVENDDGRLEYRTSHGSRLIED